MRLDWSLGCGLEVQGSGFRCIFMHRSQDGLYWLALHREPILAYVLRSPGVCRPCTRCLPMTEQTINETAILVAERSFLISVVTVFDRSPGH